MLALLRDASMATGPCVDTSMKTFHEWRAEREQEQCEGLWLNDKNAVIGLSKMNPLPRDPAVNKSLSQKPKLPPSGVPVLKPWKPAEPAQPAKIVKLSRHFAELLIVA